jgi:nucleotide-binding universal stress UspA family protein
MYQALIPVDDSEERAVAQASYVASLPNAADAVEGHLLYVFEGDGGDVPDELQPFRSATRVASVRRARERLTNAGVTVHVLEDSGDSAADIHRAADDVDADCIVMGGRKRSPTRKALFGSVTQSVVLNTDRPVVVTGASVTDTDDGRTADATTN